MKNYKEEFLKSPKKAFFVLSLPIIVSMLVQTLYNLVDTAWVGRLGSESIAALTYSFPLFFLLIAFNSGIAVGMGSRISRMLGADKREDAERTAMHGLILSFFISLLLSILGFFSLKQFFLIFGATASVLSLAMKYMSIILTGSVFMSLSFTMNSIFTAQGDTRTPMKIQIFSLIFNAILDPFFIYTLNLGVAGAAIATIIAFFISFVTFAYFLKTSSAIRLNIRSFKYSSIIAKDIIYVGVPASIMMILMSIYVAFINRFMSHFGTDYVASFGLASRLESLAIMPVVAASIAIVTLIGMLYGARRHDLLKEISFYSIKISVLFTLFVGALFFLAPTLFLRIFTSDKIILAISAKYLRIDVFTFPLMAVSIMISRIAQGMGDGTPGLIINIVRIILVAVPLAYLFVFVLGYGYLSIAVAMVLGGVASNIVAFLWLTRRLKQI
ncbi:MAG: MATE family efflux transporter [Candidatus Woesearchaeota archaeon]